MQPSAACCLMMHHESGGNAASNSSSIFHRPWLQLTAPALTSCYSVTRCPPAVHDARDPEYTILKQRLARRLRYEGTDDAKGG